MTPSLPLAFAAQRKVVVKNDTDREASTSAPLNSHLSVHCCQLLVYWVNFEGLLREPGALLCRTHHGVLRLLQATWWLEGETGQTTPGPVTRLCSWMQRLALNSHVYVSNKMALSSYLKQCSCLDQTTILKIRILQWMAP